jgi:hypothetical protein
MVCARSSPIISAVVTAVVIPAIVTSPATSRRIVLASAIFPANFEQPGLTGHHLFHLCHSPGLDPAESPAESPSAHICRGITHTAALEQQSHRKPVQMQEVGVTSSHAPRTARRRRRETAHHPLCRRRRRSGSHRPFWASCPSRCP